MSLKNWRNTKEYRKWRVGVIRRDKRCKVCSSMKKRHAHHLNHATFFPEQKFDVENGICLCSACHSIFHNKMMGGTRKKCTGKDYTRFTSIVMHVVWIALNKMEVEDVQVRK